MGGLGATPESEFLEQLFLRGGSMGGEGKIIGREKLV